MNLIEICCPEGAVDAEGREAIAEGILAELLVEPDAPRSAVERAGRISHVWFTTAQAWTTGAGRPTQAPWPVVVTITVPEVWRPELSSRAIGAVEAAFRRHAPEVDLRDPASVWINVVGVAEGSIGFKGEAVDSTSIVRYLTQDVVAPAQEGLPEGVLIDPVCGMKVVLGPRALTLDHDGRTVAFCATGCRDVYAHDHGLDPTVSGSG